MATGASTPHPRRAHARLALLAVALFPLLLAGCGYAEVFCGSSATVCEARVLVETAASVRSTKAATAAELIAAG